MMPMSSLATAFVNPESPLKLDNPVQENPMAEEKKETPKKRPHAGHGYTDTHIRHHADGSHTMKHMHEDGTSHKEYAVAGLDNVHDGLQDNLGQPNEGEQQAEGGQSGIEEGA